MSQFTDLIGLGMTWEQANILSIDSVNDSCVITTSTGLTATGNNLATALVLTTMNNEVSTTAASTGVSLPVNTPIGQCIFVQNDGASTLSVYPPTASQNFVGKSAGVAATAATTVGLFCIRLSATLWIAFSQTRA